MITIFISFYMLVRKNIHLHYFQQIASIRTCPLRRAWVAFVEISYQMCFQTFQSQASAFVVAILRVPLTCHVNGTAHNKINTAIHLTSIPSHCLEEGTWAAYSDASTSGKDHSLCLPLLRGIVPTVADQ